MPDETTSRRRLSAREHLEVARRHLGDHVLPAAAKADAYDDLTLYGFYCLEAAVMAAAAHFGWPTPTHHTGKARAAEQLTLQHGLVDIQDLLVDLNDGRKAVAYGDLDLPDLEPAVVVEQITAYVDAVARLLGDGER